MQFWFSRNQGVPIGEQIVTQVVLGVLCGDRKPGERLPSTRELARRIRSVRPAAVANQLTPSSHLPSLSLLDRARGFLSRPGGCKQRLLFLRELREDE